MAQQEKREQGMRLLAEGTPPAKVALSVGVSEMTAYRWRKRGSAERSLPSTTASGKTPLDAANIAKLGEILDTHIPHPENEVRADKIADVWEIGQVVFA